MKAIAIFVLSLGILASAAVAAALFLGAPINQHEVTKIIDIKRK